MDVVTKQTQLVTRQKLMRSFWERQKLSDEFAFIHINKCGGSAIERALGLPCFHDTASDRQRVLGLDRWMSIYTFSVVRHPYAKVVSHFYYRRETNQTGLKRSGIDLNTWVRLAYGDRNEYYYDKPLMFSQCFDWLTDAEGSVLVDQVVRLEDLDQEWPALSIRIGKPGVVLERGVKKTFGFTAKRAAAELDAVSKEIIRDRFRDDFRVFYKDAE